MTWRLSCDVLDSERQIQLVVQTDLSFQCTMFPVHEVAGHRPATSWVHYTTSCNTQSSAPEVGENYCLKHVALTGIINKPVLLHLVGCLYYLYFIIYIFFLRLAKQSQFIPLKNVVNFIIPFLLCKIFTFYINNDVLFIWPVFFSLPVMLLMHNQFYLTMKFCFFSLNMWTLRTTVSGEQKILC